MKLIQGFAEKDHREFPAIKKVPLKISTIQRCQAKLLSRV